MSAKKYLRMPTAQAKNEADERMMISIRKHVLYERQRKKQEEQEAEVEEERLRKEREARERRDVLTLGQTREKIQALEIRHQELHEKKQELFLTLKKLLNEDENRKKQQKESSEMYAMHNLVPHPGSFMPPRPMQQQDRPSQGSGSNNNTGSNGPPGGSGPAMHIRPGSSSSGGGGPPNMSSAAANKRTRSPSPTPLHGHYKGGVGGSSTGQQYPHAPKIEEGRRMGEVGRAVLWNKPNQYSTTVPGGMFYQGPPMPPNPTVEAPGRGGHPPNFFPYSTIPSQHLRPMDYQPDRNLVAAYHHQQQQQQQQQQQDRNKQQQQPPQHPQIVYDVLRWQQEQGKMPPGAPASITRGYMKRGMNE